MKKYEEAVMEVALVENAVIVTSGGCSGAAKATCDLLASIPFPHTYDSGTDSGSTSEKW